MKRRTFVSLLATTPLAACLQQPNQTVLRGHTMGTTYSVKLAPPSALSLVMLQSEIEDSLHTINRAMSTYDPLSELSRFNQSNATDWVPASMALCTVLGEALHVSTLSQGAFDVTVGPLVNLWGFGPEQRQALIPQAALLDATRARVGYHYLQVRPGEQLIRKAKPDTYVDLSGIAKGYAVDRLAMLLETHGVKDYLVEIGGELRGKGHNESGQAWQVAIEQPQPGERSIQRVVDLSGQALATSGDYRNFFELQGRRYSHMLNPITGQPVRHGLASVSVLSRSTMQADALATALQILGPERGYQLAEREGLTALFIVHDGEGFKEHASSAFQISVKA